MTAAEAADGGGDARAGVKIGVRELVEFVHREGDIRQSLKSATLAEEGVRRQRRYQQRRGAGYRSEVPVTASRGEITVVGRIDGWDVEAGLVEEIKTTRASVEALHAQHGAVHAAQLRLYAAMLADAEPSLAGLTLRLVYLHPSKPGAVNFETRAGRDELLEFLDRTCTAYARWLEAVRCRVARRNAQLRSLAFPYADFRADQRRLARGIYRGFRDAEDCLVEAPTGSGKTMASLFPALKALGEDRLDRLVFASARTTGQRAAQSALRDAAPASVAAVTITAKARICFRPEADCDPQRCEFARGYYERMPAARRQLLAAGLAGREQVESVAREHEVCPFELSLDTAAWADVVICDYNHVFDPVVRLARLANATFARVGLVVDEAHQLGERVRDMLGARLPRALLRAALRAGAAEPLARALRGVDRALAALAKTCASAEVDVLLEPGRVAGLRRAVERYGRAALETAGDGRPPAVADAAFALMRFAQATERAQREGAQAEAPPEEGRETPADGGFHYLASGRRGDFAVELVCTVPGAHIQRVAKPFHGTLRMSGTLSPPPVFQRIHGFPAHAPALVSSGHGAAERLRVLAVPDISTFYRQRQRTLPRLAALVEALRAATPGNTLVALPSFEYAEAVAGALDTKTARVQRPGMDLAEREAFIDELGASGEERRLGIVVLGGVFAESIDFDGAALRCIVVVGPSVPPRTLRRDLIAADAAASGSAGTEGAGDTGGTKGTDGDEVAYRQPAMTRVVQAVGRIARRPDERGVAVLVDPRFLQRAYARFLPQRWRVEAMPAARAVPAARAFWANA